MKFKLMELKKNIPYILYIEFSQDTDKLQMGEYGKQIRNGFKQLGIDNILVIPYRFDSTPPMIERCSWRKFKHRKRKLH